MMFAVSCILSICYIYIYIKFIVEHRRIVINMSQQLRASCLFLCDVYLGLSRKWKVGWKTKNLLYRCGIQGWRRQAERKEDRKEGSVSDWTIYKCFERRAKVVWFVAWWWSCDWGGGGKNWSICLFVRQTKCWSPWELWIFRLK